MANSRQSGVNRMLGRMGVRLWGLFVMSALLSVGIVILMMVLSVKIVQQPAENANTQIGTIITAALTIYGISAFFNGPLADRR